MNSFFDDFVDFCFLDFLELGLKVKLSSMELWLFDQSFGFAVLVDGIVKPAFTVWVFDGFFFALTWLSSDFYDV